MFENWRIDPEMLLTVKVSVKRDYMLDEIRWNKLMERLTGNLPPDEYFRGLVTAYSEPHRCYHNISHIENCLEEFDTVTNLCESPDDVEFALWLHDVVSDPHASDNEEMSAQYAMKILSDSNCPEPDAANVKELILITRHIRPPESIDARVIVDIDLSILGQPQQIFQEYESGIRAEYSWVSEDAYRIGRSGILRGFLEKSPLYSTDVFEKKYGQQARENIMKSLAALAQPPGR